MPSGIASQWCPRYQLVNSSRAVGDLVDWAGAASLDASDYLLTGCDYCDGGSGSLIHTYASSSAGWAFIWGCSSWEPSNFNPLTETGGCTDSWWPYFSWASTRPYQLWGAVEWGLAPGSPAPRWTCLCSDGSLPGAAGLSSCPSPSRTPTATSSHTSSPSNTATPSMRCAMPPAATRGFVTGSTNGGVFGWSGVCSGVAFDAYAGQRLVLITVPPSAAADGLLIVDTFSGSNFDTEIGVGAAMTDVNSCPSSGGFTCLAAANDDANGLLSRLLISAAPGSTYPVLVTDYQGTSGDYNLSWAYTPPSPRCAASLSGLSGTYAGSTAGYVIPAIGQGSCGMMGYGTSGENVVLITLPTGAVGGGGTMTVDTCGTQWDTELAVAPGERSTSCPSFAGGFICQAANDDDTVGLGICDSRSGSASSLSFAASPGLTYAVLITGYSTNEGAYTLNWRYSPPSQSSTPSKTAAATRPSTPSRTAAATRSSTATKTRTPASRSPTATRTATISRVRATSSKSRSRKAKRAAV